MNSPAGRPRPAPGGSRLRLIRQAAEAVRAVHAAGFIHRDICPRNFFSPRTART